MIFGYRVEDQVEKHGLWRNFDGTWNSIEQREINYKEIWND